MNPGLVTLVPAHLPHSSSGDRTAEVILLHIQPSFVQLQAHRLGHNGPVELTPELGVEDPLLSGLSTTLLEEVKRGGPNGPVYAETLLEALATHVIRRFGRPSTGENAVATIPMRHEMRRALEFIQERLVEDFSMRDLAQFAGLSEFHFSRMFKKSVGLSPHQYVLQQRIERAKRMLMTGSSNLAEVAIQCGFCDQSHFTSHFKRQTGLTPKRFADQSKERRFMEN